MNVIKRSGIEEEFKIQKIKNAIEDFSRLDFLSDAIELTTEEKTYLLYLYRSSIFPPLKKLMNPLTDEENSRFRTEVLDISPHDYSAILRPSSALRTYGFIDNEGDPHEDTIDCITNENFDVFFTDLVKETDCKDSYKLDSFNVNKNVTHIMTRMLCGEENISLLLYGKAAGPGPKLPNHRKLRNRRIRHIY